MTTTTTHYNLIKSQIGGRIDNWGQDVHDSYDTIDTQMKANADAAAAANTSANLRLEKSANLSDLASPANARANLGGVPLTSAVLLRADNLSDLANPNTARVNLGAHNASNLSTGTLPSPLTVQIKQISGFASVDGTSVPMTPPLDNRVVIASESCYAAGQQCNAVIASRDSYVTNEKSAVLASEGSRATSSAPSAVIASTDCQAKSRHSVILASDDCVTSLSGNNHDAIIACQGTEATGGNRVAINSSWSTVNNSRATVISSNAVATGGADIGITMGHGVGTAPSTTNRTIRLQSVSGNIDITGQVSAGATFSDFAELFPNATGAEIAPGTLLAFDAAGEGVRPADDGEDICGVMSHTAAMLAGDTPFYWAGRYEKDNWGRRIVEEVPAERASEGEGASEAVMERRLKESPQWNPELPQVPRSERPAEWTSVGLLGQVHVRTGEDVSPGDRLKAIGGKGFKSVDRTGVKVMRVEKAFDGDHGVAYCLINVRV